MRLVQRLRYYNFHQSLEDKCHRMLNAVEPGTVVPIHRRPTKDECFVVLRGKVRVTTHNDDGAVIGDVLLSRESGGYGVDVFGGVWCMVEALVLGSVIFECKAGPFSRLASSNERPEVERVEHEVDGILSVNR